MKHLAVALVLLALTTAGPASARTHYFECGKQIIAGDWNKKDRFINSLVLDRNKDWNDESNLRELPRNSVKGSYNRPIPVKSAGANVQRNPRLRPARRRRSRSSALRPKRAGQPRSMPVNRHWPRVKSILRHRNSAADARIYPYFGCLFALTSRL